MLQSSATGSPAIQPMIWLIGPKRLSNISDQVAPATIGETTTGNTSRRDEHLPPGQAVDEQLRHEQSQHELDGQRDHDEDQRVQHCLPQTPVLEQELVVEQPLERGVHVASW